MTAARFGEAGGDGRAASAEVDVEVGGIEGGDAVGVVGVVVGGPDIDGGAGANVDVELGTGPAEPSGGTGLMGVSTAGNAGAAPG